MLNGQFSLKKGLRKIVNKKEGLSLSEGPKKMGKKKNQRGLLIRTEKCSKHMDSGGFGKAICGSRVT